METDSFQTPQKIIRSHLIQQYQQNIIQNSINQNDSSGNKVIPTVVPSPTPAIYKKFYNTPGSLKKTSGLNLFPILCTPPSRKIDKVPKVVNPFEQHLAERLHLPLICSPSLFQRPATPQLCSTQFEWTIDEVSSLGPANVEAHETQFQDSLDPDIEAKAQAAISSYFKENIIVPSPSESQIKVNPKLLDESFMKQIKRVRDSTSQTVLTLPPILPPEVEMALRPYMIFNIDQQQSPALPSDYHGKKYSKSNGIDYEARDASLRRKLFDMPNFYNQNDDTIDGVPDELFANDCAAFSPAPKTPEMEGTRTNSRLFDSNSMHKNSFGFLSPISKEINSCTPIIIRKNQKTFFQTSICNSENPRQFFNKINESSILLNQTNSNKSIYRSTPDISPILTDTTAKFKNLTQSPSNLLGPKQKNEISVDYSFSAGISRLMVTSCIKKSKSDTNISLLCFTQNNNIENEDDDDFDMQISQYSNKSSNNSSINGQTPKSKPRSANRKNLSHSFSIYSDDEKNVKRTLKRHSPSNEIPNNIKLSKKNHLDKTAILSVNNCKKSNNFYRMDSGFNETDNINDELIQKNKKFIAYEDDEDVSMTCCSSTPSRRTVQQENKFFF